MPREFRVRREQVLTAPPAQVWNAVATGEGNLGWLYPMDIEPRVGGAVSRGSATVVTWEPPHRFACRTPDQDGFTTTLDYAVTPQGEAGALLSMGIHWVHTGTPDDGWDTRADAAERHFDFYRHSLAEYLRHFAGRPARYVRATRPGRAGPGALTAVRERLGLPAGAGAGDTAKVTLPHRPGGTGGPQEAVVDQVATGFLGLRTTDALYRFYDGSPWEWPLWVGHHLFAPDAEGGVGAGAGADADTDTDTDTDTEAATRAWESWLAEVAA